MMSVETKGVVLTGCKDVLLVCTLVQKSLEQLIAREHPAGQRLSGAFGAVVVELRADTGAAEFIFTYRGERRGLWVFFHADVDHRDLGPRSLSLSLGAHGDSVLLMVTVLYALSILGPTHIDENDCDEQGLEPLEQVPPTVLELVAYRFYSPFRLGRLLECFDAKVPFHTRDFKQLFGVDETTLRNLLDRGSSDQLIQVLDAWAAPYAKLGPPIKSMQS